MFDVIIIGGGVVGCGVARELSRYNLSIALLEKTDDISNGQSKANTAIVHGGYDAHPGTIKAKFNVRGNQMMDHVLLVPTTTISWLRCKNRGKSTELKN